MSSNLNDFVSKVNIASVLKHLGETDHFDVHSITPFGEFAYTNDYAKVLNSIDLMRRPELDAGGVYTKIVNEHPDLLKQEVIYHRYVQEQIYLENGKHGMWSIIVAAAQQAFTEHRYLIDDKKRTLADIYESNGFLGMVSNGFGHISLEMKERFQMEGLPEWDVLKRYKRPMILPYYHTPSKHHISFIKIFEAFESDYTKGVRLYDGDYHGFAGTRGTILPDFLALMHREGCLWDYTLDYWNNQEVEIDLECNISNLLQIIKTNKYTKFKISPITIIKERKLSPLIYDKCYLYGLPRVTVEYLQENLDLVDLLPEWLSLQKFQYQCGKTTFYKRAEGYFAYYRGVETQLTNFVFNFKEVVKKNKTNYFIIEVLSDGHHLTLTVPSDILASRTRFQLFLINQFLSNGLRQPRFFTEINQSRIHNFIFDWFPDQSI